MGVEWRRRCGCGGRIKICRSLWVGLGVRVGGRGVRKGWRGDEETRAQGNKGHVSVVCVV